MLKKLITGKKGMTLIEVLVSISILGIISVPLLAMFTNSTLMVRQNEKQIKVSALTRTIKENIAKSLKEGNKLTTYDGGDYDIASLSAVNSETDKYIGITASSGLMTKDYKYKLTYLGKPDAYATSTKEYKIKIYNSSDKLIQSIVVDINSLP